MANTTGIPIRLEGGSTITLNNGASGGGGTTSTLLLLEESTAQWENGGYEALLLYDRDVILDAYEGEAKPSVLSLDVKWTGGAQTLDVYKLTNLRDTTTGKKAYMTWVFKTPYAKGGAAGDQVTFNRIILPPGGLKVQTGKRFDMLKISLLNLDPAPTIAVY